MLLQQIKLQTNKLQALHDFYRNMLELPVTPIQDGSITISVGMSQLIFDEVKDSNPYYHFAFNIPSNKLEEAMTWLQSRVELLWLDDYKSYVADFKSWHAQSVYFLDPAGNIGELIARFDIDDIVEENFSSSHFRNVSEIGLVFQDKTFDEQVNKLLSDYQLNYFAKQPPLQHFKAIGDDEGLFIVVPKQRNWFSTKMAAGIFPVDIKFYNDGREYWLQV